MLSTTADGKDAMTSLKQAVQQHLSHSFAAYVAIAERRRRLRARVWAPADLAGCEGTGAVPMTAGPCRADTQADQPRHNVS